MQYYFDHFFCSVIFLYHLKNENEKGRAQFLILYVCFKRNPCSNQFFKNKQLINKIYKVGEFFFCCSCHLGLFLSLL